MKNLVGCITKEVEPSVSQPSMGETRRKGEVGKKRTEE